MLLDQLSEFLRLLWGTVVHRPYVYAFFACFLLFSVYQMGRRRSVFHLIVAWCIAWVSEFSSTNGGVVPFGEYFYIDATRTRELWVANVPFWDSLSFVFLSYFSFMLAAGILAVREGADTRQSPWPSLFNKWTPVLGGFLMMLLDVVIDPLTLQGEKWFLGKIYGYPEAGFYFGVTLANFLGWFFVGWLSQAVLQGFLRVTQAKGPWRSLPSGFIWGIFGVYAGIFGFNLFMTFWIEDYVLGKTSCVVAALTLIAVYSALRRPIYQQERKPPFENSCMRRHFI